MKLLDVKDLRGEFKTPDGNVVAVNDLNFSLSAGETLGIVAVYATLLVPGMIMFESFLSFLGLGVQEPMTSWGALLDEGSKSMEVAIWQLLFPAGFMVVTLFCFNFLGDGLRDALDPKDR